MFEVYDEDIARRAMEIVVPSVEVLRGPGGPFKRADFTMQLARREGENFTTLATHDFGNPDQWEHRYDGIADGKLDITARTGLPSRVAVLMRPELLKSTDVRYWGSWIESSTDIVIAACSGVQPWLDEMVSKMLVAAAKGLIETEMKVLDARRESTGADFFDGKIAVRPS